MTQKRAIILSEYLTDMRELYAYLQPRVPPDVEVIFIEFDARRYSTSYWYRLKYHLFYKVKKVGLGRIARGLFKKQDIVLSSGPSRFYRLICEKVILLNHGWGTKTSPGNAERADPKAMRKYRALLRNTDVVMCLSDFNSTQFVVCPELENERRPAFMPLGLPRNDYLIRHANDAVLREKVRNQLKIPTDWRAILIAPTHREEAKRDKQLISELLEELRMIDDRLGEEQIVLLFRPHYYETGVGDKIAGLKNVRYVGYDVWRDPRDLMILSSALVTDYSSIFVDYLLLDKPIVFRVGDIEEYTEYRGLIIDYDNATQTPGRKIKSLVELLEFEWEEKGNIRKAQEFFYMYPDGKATERIGDFLMHVCAVSANRTE